MISPDELHWILLCVAAAALVVAAAHDVAVRTVPNLVPLIVAATGLGINAANGQLLSALFSGGMVFAGTWYCWSRGWLGGGDVKLLAACAALVPPASVPALVITTAISGAILALFYLALGRLPLNATRARPSGLLGRVWRVEWRRIRRRSSLPYACAISAGVLLTLAVAGPIG